MVCSIAEMARIFLHKLNGNNNNNNQHTGLFKHWSTHCPTAKEDGNPHRPHLTTTAIQTMWNQICVLQLNCIPAHSYMMGLCTSVERCSGWCLNTMRPVPILPCTTCDSIAVCGDVLRAPFFGVI